MESLLEIRQVSKRYGSTRALEGVSFTVDPGQVVGLVGPNGSGKTTLLHAVVGLVRPDAGQILVGGFEHGSPEAKRRLGFMPDGLPRPEVLTGYEFIELTAALRGMPVDRGWLDDIRREFDLDPRWLDRPLGTLSQGTGRKIDLIAALVTDPQLLILDEPFGGLDPLVSSRLEERVRNWPGESRGVLLSTHDMGMAQRLCDWVVVLSGGRVVAASTVDGVLALAGATDLRGAFLTLTGS